MSEKSTNKPESRPPFGGPPGGRIGAPVEKAKNFKGTLRRLGSVIKPYWKGLLTVMIFAVASTIFTIVSPRILGDATNQIVDNYVQIKAYDAIMDNLPDGVTLPSGTTGADIIGSLPKDQVSALTDSQIDLIETLDLSSRPEFDFDGVLQIVALLIVLYILSAVFSYIQGWVMASITQKVSYNMRRQISKKINNLPLSYFDKRTYGEVLSRVTNDVDTVSQTLNQSLSQIVSSLVMIVGMAYMMFTISWLLTLVALTVLPAELIVIRMITKKSQKHFVKQQEVLGNINGHVEEMYSGYQVVKAFNAEQKAISRFGKLNDKLYESVWKSQFYSGMMFPLTFFVGNLGYVGVAVTGGWLAIDGRIKIGDIQAFIQYVQQFNQPITQTANIASVLQSTVAAAERVFEFLDEKEQTDDNQNPVELKRVEGAVEFRDVNFGYDVKKPVIKNFSASIKPGYRVAIVGPTGAGKTTLVNLLMRFYEVDSGEILIDGVDIRDMRRSDVRKMFGMVLQDTWLFSGTIRDNLKYGNPKVNDKDMIAAAREAHVDHFVRSLPGGYDMIVNEEANNISQGEKQLLTIARAMLAKTPMLILDEATSSVDTRTELLIQQAMDRLMAGKTSFVIAHRLSTIKNADLILVVRDGSIVEQGKHEHLLELNGAYAELYNSQFN